MKRLNRSFRRKNYPTDVLSFSLALLRSSARSSKHPQEKKHTFIVGGDDDLLGEVVLCFPMLKKNARRMKHSLQREFQTLTIHGVLHLLGYDHERPRDARAMKKAGNALSSEFII